MKKTIVLLCLLSVIQTLQSQYLINNGAFLTQLNGGYFVVSNGNLLLLNQNITCPFTIFKCKITENASLKIDALSHLTVSQSIVNLSGVDGLMLLSSESGTASLLHNNNGVNATVFRYITGGAATWHLLSSPVVNQSISGSWTPAGSFPDGTGYDFYGYDEPSAIWINQKISGNNISNFEPGKGYLIDYQSITSIKEFTGPLNNNQIDVPVTSSNTGSFSGMNLIGNPYPSAIDWKTESGWTRTNLVNNSGGYDMYIWNQSANNYGTYNSAALGDIGTNSATRYIAPMQGFFVDAAYPGTLSMTNVVRRRAENTWLKNTFQKPEMRIMVSSEQQNSFDEVLIEFGHESDGGAIKQFSFVSTAPSLFSTHNETDYAIRFVQNTISENLIPLSFMAGIDGAYTLHFTFEEVDFKSITLIDKLTGIQQNLLENRSYQFNAGISDNPERFEIHFGLVGVEERDEDTFLDTYYAANTIHISNPQSSAELMICNFAGQCVYQMKLQQTGLLSIPIHLKSGVYLVSLIGKNIIQTKKLMIL